MATSVQRWIGRRRVLPPLPPPPPPISFPAALPRAPALPPIRPSLAPCAPSRPSSSAWSLAPPLSLRMRSGPFVTARPAAAAVIAVAAAGIKLSLLISDDAPWPLPLALSATLSAAPCMLSSAILLDPLVSVGAFTSCRRAVVPNARNGFSTIPRGLGRVREPLRGDGAYRDRTGD